MKKILAAVAASALAGLASANAAVVFSETFDDEAATFGTTLNFTDFDQFSVDSGSVDLIGTPNPYGISCVGATGGCIDLDGTTPGVSPASRLVSLSSFNLVPGLVYTLSFDYSGNQRNANLDGFSFSLGGIVADVISSVPGGNDFTTYTVQFTVLAATSAALTFEAPGAADNIGIILDNVLLTSDPVPVPAALPLFATALAGAGALRRLRRKPATA